NRPAVRPSIRKGARTRGSYPSLKADDVRAAMAYAANLARERMVPLPSDANQGQWKTPPWSNRNRTNT
ncbi:MAG: hypothetical protein LLG00_00465, partial [Planctomycetaceae bacterium]|nr:hypothetical protein [Planctomycetaceae bacterium]